jgi:hypothetical protein
VCYKSRIAEHRWAAEPSDPYDPESLTAPGAGPVDGPEVGAATTGATVDGDRVGVVAREISELMSSATDSALQLAATAERRATACVAAAGARADELLAEAESRRQAIIDDAKAQLEEACALLHQAQERDRAVRREADEYARAVRADLAHLQAEVAADQQRVGERLARSTDLLATAEVEISQNLDHATLSLAVLSRLRDAITHLQGEPQPLGDRSELVDLTSRTCAPPETDGHEVDQPEVVGDAVDQPEGGAEPVGSGASPNAGVRVEPEGERDDGQLERTLRAAVARAIDQASGAQRPGT